MNHEETEILTELLRRFVESQESLVRLFEQREETDREIVRIRQAEYDRLDRWREEDLVMRAKERLEDVDRVFGRFLPKTEEPT